MKLLLNDVKKALRISSSHFDDELMTLIESARLDMIQSGISFDKAHSDDFLIKQTIVFYCKGHFGYDNPDANRFMAAYHSNLNKLSFVGDYRET